MERAVGGAATWTGERDSMSGLGGEGGRRGWEEDGGGRGGVRLGGCRRHDLDVADAGGSIGRCKSWSPRSEARRETASIFRGGRTTH